VCFSKKSGPSSRQRRLRGLYTRLRWSPVSPSLEASYILLQEEEMRTARADVEAKRLDIEAKASPSRHMHTETHTFHIYIHTFHHLHTYTHAHTHTILLTRAMLDGAVERARPGIGPYTKREPLSHPWLGTGM